MMRRLFSTALLLVLSDKAIGFSITVGSRERSSVKLQLAADPVKAERVARSLLETRLELEGRTSMMGKANRRPDSVESKVASASMNGAPTAPQEELMSASDEPVVKAASPVDLSMMAEANIPPDYVPSKWASDPINVAPRVTQEEQQPEGVVSASSKPAAVEDTDLEAKSTIPQESVQAKQEPETVKQVETKPEMPQTTPKAEEPSATKMKTEKTKQKVQGTAEKGTEETFAKPYFISMADEKVSVQQSEEVGGIDVGIDWESLTSQLSGYFKDLGSLGKELSEQLSSTLGTSLANTTESEGFQTATKRIVEETKEFGSCLGLAASAVFKPETKVTVEDIVLLCDEIDALEPDPTLVISEKLQLRRRVLEFKRYEMLAKLMKSDYDAYVKTASFLSPSRIPRIQLPNIQDVPYDKDAEPVKTLTSEEGLPLVADCELEDMKYKDSPLDTFLLGTFRRLVEKNTGGITSEKEGIAGLLEQGRTFMLKPGQTPEAQHKMVYNTLGGLMTPVLPPFYRIFMSGVVPKVGSEYDGKQFGPWFYAPWLTSIVTPTFFGFLVGPSRPNRRKDGEVGGLVVEKCKFLQESGCKGLCLHQCKLPAQQFFKEELGLPLTVSPNFVTQECQWSFGEEPLPYADDPSFPKGCLSGCESRKAMAATYADLNEEQKLED